MESTTLSPISEKELTNTLKQAIRLTYSVCFLKRWLTVSYLCHNTTLGTEGTVAVIGRLIVDYIEFADIKTINENTLQELVQLIMEDYSWLGIYDIAHFCRLMKKSQFSKCYGNVNAPQIFAWLKEYESIRYEVFDRLERQEDRKRLEKEYKNAVSKNVQKEIKEHKI